MEITIEGIVESKIFYNEENHYGVFRVSSTESNDRPLTIVGSFYKIELDAYYEFSGEYIENPRFGLQFQVNSYVKKLPIHDEYVVRYLSSAAFPGIGPKTARMIVDAVGPGFLEMMRDDTSVQFEIEGVSKEKIDSIRSVIVTQDATDDAIQFLNTHGITGKIIHTILGVYENDTVSKLKINPYRMVDEVVGVGFALADRLGTALGFEKNHVFRLEGYLIHEYKIQCFNQGHSFIYKSEFIDTFPESEFDTYMHAYNALVLKRIFEEEGEKLYHYTQYDAENSVAQFLTREPYPNILYVENLDSTIELVEKRMGISFDRIQKEAIARVFEDDFVIITGGPGTGKSTLLAGLISAIQISFSNAHITLCAPTGRAAKRLENLTHVTASTIHSVLKWNLHTNTFGMSAANPLETDIVIVDEFSMVDVWLLSKLFDACEKVPKFVFVGDRDQLPSVGPGYVLGDLLATDVFPTIELKHNYRQEQGSEVIDLAIDMNQGVFDVSGYQRDVKFFDSRYGNAKDVVVRVVEEAMDRGYSLQDIQVLSPKYGGSTGIDNLNYFLQKTCNPDRPSKRSIQVGTRIFREGDKILQLKNQPDDGVFNGDIGTLVEIEDGKQLTVDFQDTFVTYDRSNLINISHAYAMSVHKAQGSEYPIVILLGMPEYGQMLSRKLYYTAITRSSKSVVLVGDARAFVSAAQNNHELVRNTALQAKILAKIKTKVKH